MTDFWRRWHISLSTWLRDYLYIPLGGSRGGEV
ncbi:MBOAT family O-acyltransferase [Arenimonas daejeonensis]